MRSTLVVNTIALAALLGSGCGDNLRPEGGSPSAYTIGGAISGLAAEGLVLQDNGADDLAVPAGATSFVFATAVSDGSAYAVTVRAQPAGQVCTVTAGGGIATADVRSVAIACVARAANQWTWEGGSDTAPDYGRPGVYGTLGTAAAGNIPGGRHQSASWRDAAGNFWLFGGFGVDAEGASGQLDDLWTFDPTSRQWTWISGTKVAPASTTGGAGGSAGVYGTLGTAAAANVPGGREQVSSWVDASGAVWIFGGEGIDAYGVTGELNDLWKFSGGTWTWMGGSDSVGSPLVFGGPAGVYGTRGTPSTTNIPGGRYGAVSWMDAAGDLWLFGGSGIDAAGFAGSLDYLNDLWRYTPSTGAWTWMAGPSTVPAGPPHGAAGIYGTLGTPAATNYPGGRDAAMSWQDAAGNVWIFGGIGIDATGTFGFLNDLWKYSPTTGLWTWVNGSSTVGQENGGPSGVYGTLGTPAAANVPGGRFSGAAWVDSTGSFWLFGGQGYDAAGGIGVLADLWRFDPIAGTWTWMSGSDTVGTSGGQPGVYGMLGVPAAANAPGSRFGIPTWTDASGKLWLFGGLGNDANGDQGYLDDLWSYQP